MKLNMRKSVDNKQSLSKRRYSTVMKSFLIDVYLSSVEVPRQAFSQSHIHRVPRSDVEDGPHHSRPREPRATPGKGLIAGR